MMMTTTWVLMVSLSQGTATLEHFDSYEACALTGVTFVRATTREQIHPEWICFKRYDVVAPTRRHRHAHN